jgi:hypothetical protein
VPELALPELAAPPLPELAAPPLTLLVAEAFELEFVLFEPEPAFEVDADVEPELEEPEEPTEDVLEVRMEDDAPELVDEPLVDELEPVFSSPVSAGGELELSPQADASSVTATRGTISCVPEAVSLTICFFSAPFSQTNV